MAKSQRVFFFKLEGERFEKNNLTSILDEHDNEVFAREEIKRAHVQFYTKFFSEESIDAICKQCFEERKFCDEPFHLFS